MSRKPAPAPADPPTLLPAEGGAWRIEDGRLVPDTGPDTGPETPPETPAEQGVESPVKEA